MNQKKVKALRKKARDAAPAGTPIEKWEIANRSKFVGHPGTIEVAPKSVRGIYRGLKKAAA